MPHGYFTTLGGGLCETHLKRTHLSSVATPVVKIFMDCTVTYQLDLCTYYWLRSPLKSAKVAVPWLQFLIGRSVVINMHRVDILAVTTPSKFLISETMAELRLFGHDRG